ncbi:MAG: RnfABCDGE type electron transport complex subunit D [Christensenellales bacterium]
MKDIRSLFTKQKMMRTVLVSLIPVALMAVYLFGWRPVLMGLVVTLAAVICEYLVMHSIQGEKTKVSEAALVSAVLFTLTLPPRTPIWIAVIGIAFGIVFGKAAFGGFAKNVFNPALVGRCFVYIAFPGYLTAQWSLPFTGFPGGFASWLPNQAADMVTGATPMLALEHAGVVAPLDRLFLGTIAGSLGETSALLILLGGAYLLYRKVASWQIMLSTICAGLGLSAALYYTGVTAAPPLFSLLSGGFLFGAVYMATDPVSAPKMKNAQWIYGAFIGCVTVIIRSFSLFTEGIMFAILIGNALVPLLELQLKQLASRAKVKGKEAAV